MIAYLSKILYICNMIRARIQIADGEIYDTATKWGLIYTDSDKRIAPPEKKRDTTSYPEKAGENADKRTVLDAFDYKVSFAITAPNKDLRNANVKIKAFNDAVREKIAGSDVMKCKTVTFYDDYKRVKIVGIPEVLDEAKSFYRISGGGVLDCVEVELTIHVDNPKLCDFSTNTDNL